MLSTLWQDIRYGARMLLKTPGVSIVVIIALALGTAAAFVLTRWMSSMLFGVSASDAATYALVVFVSLGAALLACSIPARRATRVDPLVALRYE